MRIFRTKRSDNCRKSVYFQDFPDSFKTLLGTKYFFKKRRNEGKKTSTCARKKEKKRRRGKREEKEEGRACRQAEK